jgi:hypothetical protein
VMGSMIGIDDTRMARSESGLERQEMRGAKHDQPTRARTRPLC